MNSSHRKNMLNIAVIFCSVGFLVWFLYDRYKLIKITKEKIKQLEIIYQKSVEDNQVVMDNIQWENILINSCLQDQEDLETIFNGVFSFERFNNELTLAANSFSKHLHNKNSVRTDVARICNLLQSFVIASKKIIIDAKQLN